MSMIDSLTPPQRRALQLVKDEQPPVFRVPTNTRVALETRGYIRQVSAGDGARLELTEAGQTLFVEDAMRTHKSSDFAIEDKVEFLDWRLDGDRWCFEWHPAIVIAVGKARLHLHFRAGSGKFSGTTSWREPRAVRMVDPDTKVIELENARINAGMGEAADLRQQLHRMTLEAEAYRIQAEEALRLANRPTFFGAARFYRRQMKQAMDNTAYLETQAPALRASLDAMQAHLNQLRADTQVYAPEAAARKVWQAWKEMVPFGVWLIEGTTIELTEDFLSAIINLGKALDETAAVRQQVQPEAAVV